MSFKEEPIENNLQSNKLKSPLILNEENNKDIIIVDTLNNDALAKTISSSDNNVNNTFNNINSTTQNLVNRNIINKFDIIIF